jgi:hypothetical protein
MEDNSGIARREVPGHDHLINVADGSSQQKTRRPDHRGGTKAESPAKRKKADHRVAQARHSDLGLERAWLPADEPGGHVAEKDVNHEVVQERESNRKQQEKRKQFLHNHGGGQWTIPPPQREPVGNQPQSKERDGEVLQQGAQDGFQVLPRKALGRILTHRCGRPPPADPGRPVRARSDSA